jgi:hypothetical protein
MHVHAVCAAAERMPYRISVCSQGKTCVYCDALALKINFPVLISKFFVPQDIISRLGSVLLFSEGDAHVGAGERGITGFWEGEVECLSTP